MELNTKPPTLVTKKEAALLLKSSVKTIDRLLKSGRVRGFKIGCRKVLIYEYTLTEEYINSIKPKFI
jgi:excisionase family DNA binding protein